jgi:hypothetical protein
MSAKTVMRAVALVAMAMLAAAGCGGSSKKSTTSGATTTVPAAVAAYVHCLQSHGMKSATSVLPPSQVSAAQTACAGSLPTRGAVNYRSCQGQFGVTNAANAKAARSDPHFKAATQICSELRKKAGSSTSTTGT